MRYVSEIGSSLTISRILVRLILFLYISLVGSEEYLLKDVYGEWDCSIGPQVGWCVVFFHVLPEGLFVYVKAPTRNVCILEM